MVEAAAEASIPGEDEGRTWRLALVVVLAAAAVRLALAGLVPLLPYETYYWEWSRRPAPSYFDHPPAISAVIAFGTALFGDTRVGVRFGAVLLSLVGSVASIALTRRLADGKAALVSALALSVMPMAAAGLLLATPDAPLLAAFAVATWALIRALENEPGSMREVGWWCATGLALGAALLSKYTAVLLPAGVLLGFAVDPRLRRRLLTPGPWIGLGLGLAAFSPVIMWNAQLGWPSFAFQLDHGFGGGGSDARLLTGLLGSVNRVFEYLGGQLGLVSPILFVLMGTSVILALRGGLRGQGDSRKTVLASVAILVFGTFALSALRRHVEPNWPAPAYVAGIVLLGARWKVVNVRWLRWGLWLGAVLVVGIYVQALMSALPIDARRDPIAQGHGWESLAEVTEVARAEFLGAGCPSVHVATNRYQEASELAFHLPGHPAVFSLNVRRRSNQYAVWPGFEDTANAGDCLVFVDIDDRGARRIADGLGDRFDSMTEIGPTQRKRGRGVTADYRLWGFTGWTGESLTPGP